MEYILVCFVAIAFVVVGLIIERKKLNEMISNLSDEQKNKLELTEVKFIEGKNDEWIQDAMISKISNRGIKFSIKILWYNTVIQNGGYEKIQYGIASLSKKDVETNGLKVGDFVKVKIAPAKTSGIYTIIL